MEQDDGDHGERAEPVNVLAVGHMQGSGKSGAAAGTVARQAPALHVSPVQQPVYITRPERMIWPVIALVAATLFSAATEATLGRVRLALDRQATVQATVRAEQATEHAERATERATELPGSGGTVDPSHGLPSGELKPADRPGIIARQGQHKAAPEVRVAVRRAATLVRLRATVAQGRSLEVKSHRQVVISARSGGLVRYFPTAPPRV